MAKKVSPITPGDVLLEEFLKPMNISQNQLAKDINVPANRIIQVIHGKRENQRRHSTSAWQIFWHRA